MAERDRELARLLDINERLEELWGRVRDNRLLNREEADEMERIRRERDKLEETRLCAIRDEIERAR